MNIFQKLTPTQVYARVIIIFSQVYFKLDKKIKQIIEIKASTREVDLILKKSLKNSLTFEEIAKLLNAKNNVEKIRKFVIKQYRNGRNSLRHIAPVYLSSCCIDKCSYCHYSANRTCVQRTKLSLKEFEKELKEGVLPEGNKVIELTLATDPEFTSEKLAKYIDKTKKLLKNETGSGILLCSDYLSLDDYQRLRKAGLWGMVQWDETLDQKEYLKWHKYSPRKSRFKERIDNHDRAIQAGLQVATGCLFGLTDYRYDVLMQIAKAKYFKDAYGIKPFVFGTARLKSVGGMQLHTKYKVSDVEYELALLVYKIAEPEIARWLQTREKPELNLRNIVNNDVYTYTCGNVKPGGYHVNKKIIDNCKGSQFQVKEIQKTDFEERLNELDFVLDYSWIK